MKTRINYSHKFMGNRRLAVSLALALGTLMVSFAKAEEAKPRQVKIGYFEGGAYPYHNRLKDEFLNQLNAILPDSIEAVFAPDGYRTAEWDKKKSAAMAKELSGVKSLDLIVAMGPWVINDLLSAGFNRPIVGMHQFAPQYENLLDKSGKPKATNLTLQVRRNKIRDDLMRLSSLMNLKKLGLIYFPSTIEADSVLNDAKAVGRELGFEVVTSTGTDNKGTFAFFNAFNALDKKIDALYLPPIWGLDIQMVNQLFYLTDVQKLPVMTSEDKFLVDRGALLSNAAYDIFSEARFHAYKAAQIILGATPKELQVDYAGGISIAINEKTAAKCKIKLRRILYREAEVITGMETDESAPLTLPDAIARAVSFNPGILAQRETMNAATAAASQASSDYLPKLNATVGFGHRDDNYVYNSRNELKQDYFATELNLRQKIFSLETIRSIKIAAKEKQIENTNSVLMQQKLELAVTLAYLNYLKALEVIDEQKRIRQLIERNIEISGTVFLVENGSEYEHSRWQVERDRSIQALTEAEGNLKVARVLLNTLLNYPTDQILAIPKDAFGIGAVSVTFNNLSDFLDNSDRVNFAKDALNDYAAQNNSRVNHKRQELDLQNVLLSQNKARYYPSLDLIAGYRISNDQNDTPPPFKEETDSWTIGGSISIPLFLGFDRTREKNKLTAEYSRTEYERDETLLDVKAGVQSSFHKMLASFDKLATNVRRVDRSKFNLEIIINGYDAGDYDVQFLINEMQSVTDADMEEIVSRYDMYDAMAHLAFELGWTAYGSGTTFTQQIETLILEN